MDGLGEIGNFLLSLFRGQGGQQQAPASIAGQSTPQQQVQNLASAGFPGAQQMTAPTRGGGVTDYLSDPLVSGALATWLGTLSQPHAGGWTRALAHGGLSGLEAFGQARSQQAQAPLAQAKLAEAQAQVPYMQAETAHMQLTDQQLQDEMARRQKAADQIDTDPTLSKLDQTHRFLLKQSIFEGKASPADLGLMTPFQQKEVAHWGTLENISQQRADREDAHLAAEKAHWKNLEDKGGGTVTDAESFRAFSAARSRWETSIAALDPNAKMPAYLTNHDLWKREMLGGGSAATRALPSGGAMTSKSGRRIVEDPDSPSGYSYGD